MRPAKWYAVRPDRRTTARTVVIRPVIEPVVLPAPPRTGGGWRIAAVAVPVVISVFALLVSWRTYSDQHSADAAAAATGRQQYARLVAAWLTPGVEGPSDLVVQNLGASPAGDVTVQLAPVSRRVSNFWVWSLPIYVGIIAPCTVVTVDLTTEARYLVSYVGAALRRKMVTSYEGVRQVNFVDDTGLAWVRDDRGDLRNQRPPQGSLLPVVSSAMHTSAARGCV